MGVLSITAEDVNKDIAHFNPEHIEWLVHNGIKDYFIDACRSIKFDDIAVIYFDNPEDAMAFKLRWL